MQNHIYATFTDPKFAEKAAGALLDNGVRAEDITVIQHHSLETEVVYPAGSPVYAGDPAGVVETTEVAKDHDLDADKAAKHGLSTTTAGDAGIGAAKGAGWGIGIGAVAALAALFVPGVGLVIGGGALAMAVGAAAATTGAGAVAGAVTGYLKDQGFEEKEAQHYEEVVAGGGAILSLALPSGPIDEPKAWEVIDKYNGSAFSKRPIHATY